MPGTPLGEVAEDALHHVILEVHCDGVVEGERVQRLGAAGWRAGAEECFGRDGGAAPATEQERLALPEGALPAVERGRQRVGRARFTLQGSDRQVGEPVGLGL